MIVRQVPWQPEHDKRLMKAAGCKSDLDAVKAEVIAGVAELWLCQSERAEGYIVTRLELPDEWVIVLGEGSGFMEFVPVFVDHARRMGWTVRMHVKRRGLIRMARRLGLHLDEYVLRG